MRKLMERMQIGFSFHGGGMPSGGAPVAPKPPPPPAPPPTKEQDDVQEKKKEALERKKFAKGRDDTLLKQTGSQGTTQKKVLLGK